MFLEANEFSAKLGRGRSSAVRSKALSFRVFFMLVATVSFGADSAPVDCTHLMAWIAGGVSGPKLIHVVERRGIAFTPSPNLETKLCSAGATSDLLETLHHLQPVHGSSCPASLVKAATLVHEKKYEPAAELFGQLLASDSQNGALHFALGYIQQQQGDWDTAFDEYSNSKESEPDFSEVHNRLALVFYQGDDGDSAIGEARTALSMDF
jgi:tetratricopeptide (TPR) repeat protein